MNLFKSLTIFLVFSSSRAASISSKKVNGLGLNINIAIINETASIDFSPPESSNKVCSGLFLYFTLSSSPVSSIFSSSSSLIAPFAPFRIVSHIYLKLLLISSNAMLNFSIISFSISPINVRRDSLLASRSFF